MADQLVVLRTYPSEMEARLHAAILEAGGIPAEVMADTAGGLLPSMALVFPVRLLVRESDESIANELLDTPAEASGDDVGSD